MTHESKLKKEYEKVIQDLTFLNHELAKQMVHLAAQTGQTRPLESALSALRTANLHGLSPSARKENINIQCLLADTLLSLGKSQQDMDTIGCAIQSYDEVINLASIFNSNLSLLRPLKKKRQMAQKLFNKLSENTPSRGVA